MKTTPTPATWSILGGGLVVLLGSFLDFFEFSAFGQSAGANAWDGDLPWFPVTLIPVICGVVMAVVVALAVFSEAKLPDRVLGLSWDQVHLALGFQALITMVAFLIVEKGGLDIAIGFWLMMLGSIALLVGAVMRQREATPAV